MNNSKMEIFLVLKTRRVEITRVQIISTAIMTEMTWFSVANVVSSIIFTVYLSPILHVVTEGCVNHSYASLPDLSWTNHINIITSTAQKLVGLLFRQFYIDVQIQTPFVSSTLLS